eukprot:Gb_24174 [translate_table: standard]
MFSCQNFFLDPSSSFAILLGGTFSLLCVASGCQLPSEFFCASFHLPSSFLLVFSSPIDTVFSLHVPPSSHLIVVLVLKQDAPFVLSRLQFVVIFTLAPSPTCLIFLALVSLSVNRLGHQVQRIGVEITFNFLNKFVMDEETQCETNQSMPLSLNCTFKNSMPNMGIDSQCVFVIAMHLFLQCNFLLGQDTVQTAPPSAWTEETHFNEPLLQGRGTHAVKTTVLNYMISPARNSSFFLCICNAIMSRERVSYYFPVILT